MMAPPTLAYQRIATNLQRLLNEALERHDPTRTAFQRAGLNVAPAVEYYDPEPDVVVIDSAAAETPGERYANRFYLAAEIVSESDRTYVESKRAVYKLHETCTCVLTVELDRAWCAPTCARGIPGRCNTSQNRTTCCSSLTSVCAAISRNCIGELQSSRAKLPKLAPILPRDHRPCKKGRPRATRGLPVNDCATADQ